MKRRLSYILYITIIMLSAISCTKSESEFVHDISEQGKSEFTLDGIDYYYEPILATEGDEWSIYNYSNRTFFFDTVLFGKGNLIPDLLFDFSVELDKNDLKKDMVLSAKDYHFNISDFREPNAVYLFGQDFIAKSGQIVVSAISSKYVTLRFDNFKFGIAAINSCGIAGEYKYHTANGLWTYPVD